MSFKYFRRQMELMCNHILGPEAPDVIDLHELAARGPFPPEMIEVAKGLRNQLKEIQRARADRHLAEWELAVWLSGLAYADIKAQEFRLKQATTGCVSKFIPDLSALHRRKAEKREERKQAAIQELRRRHAAAPKLKKNDLLDRMAEELMVTAAGDKILMASGKPKRLWGSKRTLVEFCKGIKLSPEG